MLDISVPELRKELKKIDEQQFLNDPYMVILEKFDGTKLTLLRNSLPRKDDYALNWTISYKGNVIFPQEFAGVSDDMLQDSVGVCQYKRVFDHLRSLPRNVDIDHDVELFVEFVQNKPTLTRDYERFGDMYLIGYAEMVEPLTLGLRTYTTSDALHIKRNKEFADKLRLKLPPVLHSGRLSEKHDSIQSVIDTYSDFTSSLGGKAEGVVILHGCQMFKVVARDQYDKTVRKAKKMRFALDEPFETEYWVAVKKQARHLVQLHWSDDIAMMMHYLSCTIYGMDRFELKGNNVKKHDVVLRDDLMLTAKLAYEEMRERLGLRIGVIPMAGRPVHAGHWCLIENAAAECDTVYLFVSIKGRGEGQERIEPGTMLRIWKYLLIPKLPRWVVVRFVDSPVFDANRFVKGLEDNKLLHFKFFGDEEDANERWNAEALLKTFSDLYKEQRITVRGYSRSDTVQVSGTEMRKMLSDGTPASRVMEFLPHVLSEIERERYLGILAGNDD